MPASLSIAAFVLGAVLLLISLLPGGFKIFGAEVSGTAGSGGRFIAFVLGLVFIITGLSLHERPPLEVASEANHTRTVPNRPPATPIEPAPQVTTAPTPATTVSIEKTAPSRTPSPSIDGPISRLLEAKPRLNLKWDYDVAAMQSLMAQANDLHKLTLFLNLATTGTDVYAARIVLTNTGTAPVNVSPRNVRVRAGTDMLRSDTLDVPGALRATVVPREGLVEGLIVFQAPIVAVALGQVSMTYEDPDIQVSYLR